VCKLHSSTCYNWANEYTLLNFTILLNNMLFDNMDIRFNNFKLSKACSFCSLAYYDDQHIESLLQHGSCRAWSVGLMERLNFGLIDRQRHRVTGRL
jgi:hypothetical protein